VSTKLTAVVAVVALASLVAVAVVVRTPGPTALAQGETIVDKINDKFMARMEAKQHAADLGTVKDAAHVNQLFGGSFSDGVGSNTWAGTHFQKYDYKDGARMESLSQVSAAEKHAQIVKCVNLAKNFKGIKKGHFKVTEAEKIEASQCAVLFKGKKGEAKKRNAVDTTLEVPKLARPDVVHIFKPNKALLGKRAKFLKHEKVKFAQMEAVKAKAREDAMHPHIIKAKHFFPHAKKGAKGKMLKQARLARKELSQRKMPSFVTSQSFDDRQGARKSDVTNVDAKMNFWEGMGSEPEHLKTSVDRSKTEYIVTDPMAGARKSQKTSALLQQHTTMLLQ